MIEINVGDIFIRIDRHLEEDESLPVPIETFAAAEPEPEPEPAPRSSVTSKTMWSCIVGSVGFVGDIAIQQASSIYQNLQQFSALKYFQAGLIALTMGSFIVIAIERYKKLRQGI